MTTIFVVKGTVTAQVTVGVTFFVTTRAQTVRMIL